MGAALSGYVLPVDVEVEAFDAESGGRPVQN